MHPCLCSSKACRLHPWLSCSQAKIQCPACKFPRTRRHFRPRTLPSKYAFRIKACGTLKSRLCILGNLMPKDEMDVSSPTPRLSSFRLLLAHAIRNSLEVDAFDVDNAFVSAASKGATYIRLPPGRDQPGKAALLLKNLYGSAFAPRLFSNLLHNWLTANGFISSPAP